MKLLFTLGVIAFISSSVFAQETKEKHSDSCRVTIGIKAGMTIAEAKSFNAGSTALYAQNYYLTNPVTSLYFGATFDVRVSKFLSVQPALLMVGKGTALATFDGEKKYLPWYLEMPVNFVLNLEVGPGKVFLGAGPYVGVGVFGGYRDEFGSRILRYGSNTELANTYNDLRCWDFGLNFLLGYQLKKGFNVHGGYGLGLTNIAANAKISGDSASFKNGVFSVGLGYAF